MNKYILALTSFLTMSSFAMQKCPMTPTMTERYAIVARQAVTRGFQIPESHILRMNDTTGCSLWWTSKGFSVQQPGYETCYIDRSDLDTTLQNISATNILRYLNAGKFALSKASDGSYLLRSHIDGKGGGALGFALGFFSGKFLVYGIQQGIGLGLCVVTSPFITPAGGGALWAAWTSASAPFTEFASNQVGATTGMAVAVATGPV